MPQFKELGKMGRESLFLKQSKQELKKRRDDFQWFLEALKL